MKNTDDLAPQTEVKDPNGNPDLSLNTGQFHRRPQKTGVQRFVRAAVSSSNFHVDLMILFHTSHQNK